MRKLVAVFLMMMGATAQGHAATTFYTDRTAFDSAVNGLTTEEQDFDALAQINPLISGTSYDFGAFDFMYESQDGSDYGQLNQNTLVNVQLQPLFRVGGNNATTTMRFDFASPVLGFGGFWALVGGSGLALNVGAASAAIPNGSFFGVVSDTPFTSAFLTATGTDEFVFDDAVTAFAPAAVPLPPAVLFSLAGLGLLAGLSRMRKLS